MIAVFSGVTVCSLVNDTASHAKKNQYSVQSERNCQTCPTTSDRNCNYGRSWVRFPEVSKDELTVVNQRKLPEFTLFIQNLDLLILDKLV